MNFQQLPFIHMGINLRCADIGVPQHFLNNTQIRTIFQQVAGKGMTQRMRMNVFLYAGKKRRFLDDAPDTLPVKTFAMTGKENIRTGDIFEQQGSGLFEITLQQIPCNTADRDDTFFGTFSKHSDSPHIEVNHTQN